MKLVPTGSQTVGPYFRIGMDHLCAASGVVAPKPVTVRGCMSDGNGQPVCDAMVEIWQANSAGEYPLDKGVDSGGRSVGFARVATDSAGCFSFTTSKPGAVPFDEERVQAPHLVVLVFARGLLRHLITRMYFPDEPANGIDPVLQSIEEGRRDTLVARSSSSDAETIEWNIVLQGQNETVFFAW